MMDSKLGHKPSKKFREGFERIHGTQDKKSINKYSDIIHKYQRNTFNHRYQAKGVFLEHKIDKFWILEESDGFMVINPYLFWNRFEEIYNETFIKILDPKNTELRNNALKYLNKLIN